MEPVRTRAARDGSLREPKSWRVLILSTGEVPIETKLAEEKGRTARAGQLVRMLDIPAERGAGFGVSILRGADGHAAKLAKALKDCGDLTLSARLGRNSCGELSRKEPMKSRPPCERRLAILSRPMSNPVPMVNRSRGATARAHCGGGRTGDAVGRPRLGAKGRPARRRHGHSQNGSKGEAGTEPAEVRQAIEQVRLFIEQHGDARFAPLDEDDARPVMGTAPDGARAKGRRANGLSRPKFGRREFAAGPIPDGRADSRRARNAEPGRRWVPAGSKDRWRAAAGFRCQRQHLRWVRS